MFLSKAEQMPLISVCILSYNHEKYISRAIDSVVNQTYGNVEIIVVDNNSTDNSVAIIKEYEKKGSIRFFELSQNTYPSHGTNFGLKKANGELICLLSGDDSYEADKLQIQSDYMQAHKIDTLFTWVNIIDDNDNVIDFECLESIFNKKHTPLSIKENFIKDGNMLCALSGMFVRRIFDDYGYFDERLLQLQDYDYWLRIIKHESIHVLPQKLTNYRVRNDGKNLSLDKSKSRYLRNEFENFIVDRHVLDFNNECLSTILGCEVTDNNKHLQLYNYYMEHDYKLKAKSILYALYVEMNESFEFPSEKYDTFYSLYSKSDFFSHFEMLELKNKINDDKKELEQKIQSLESELVHLRGVENSICFRLAKLLRFFLHQIKRVIFLAVRISDMAKKHNGFFGVLKKTIMILRYQGFSSLKNVIYSKLYSHKINTFSADSKFLCNVKQISSDVFKPNILIIAELSIPQCEKYRVIQKKEMFISLGYNCRTISWTDYLQAKELISLSSLVVFYRVPSVETIDSLIDECNRLGIDCFWEVDDLIFDKDILIESKTVQSLNNQVQEQLADGATLYKKAMLKCNMTIASTEGLSNAMLSAGVYKSFVIENALDTETIEISKAILASQHKLTDSRVRIVYGSGTSTHNVDFEEAAESIACILRERKNVVFRIIGLLELPSYFDELKEQIERISFCKYDEYLMHLAECDISIAPLEDYIFNDAKSNIKFLEASIVKIPSICSPASAFSSVIINYENGILARGNKEWYDGLLSLIDDSDLRQKTAELAYETVIKRYLPGSIANNQLSKLIDYKFKKTDKINKKRIISFNVFYSPRSFGGATVVAEQVNKQLQSNHDCEVFVVTSLLPTDFLRPYKTIRYEVEGVTVFGIAIPPEDMDKYYNNKIIDTVSDIISFVEPDIAHIHSIQGLGVGVLDACKKANLKYAITLHDAWWLCPRQFMIKENGKYCNQKVINKDICISCIADKKGYENRQNTLIPYLEDADLLLAPSKYSIDLYGNNVNTDTIILNKNGIKFPKNISEKLSNAKITFGYVGGNTPIKGMHLILDAFKNISDPDVEIVFVDNLINLGGKSFFDSELKDINNCKLIPAYNQDSIDEFFESIDVLLFPTQCKESFGLTVREATVRNVWVIATDSGGSVEDLIEGVNGNIIPFDSNAHRLRDICLEYISFHRKRVRTDDSISLEKKHIRSFSEQSVELNKYFNQLI